MKRNRDGDDYEVINSIVCVDDSDGNIKKIGYTYGKLYYEVRSNDTTRRFLDDDADLRILFPDRFRNATLLEKYLYED